MEEYQFRRLWTLDEAQAVLPEVEEALHEIQETMQKIRSRRTSAEKISPAARVNGHRRQYEQSVTELETAQARYRALLERFTTWGIEIKDIDIGLIDFPHERDGRIVYLCWKLGEDRIRYWHEINAGYLGRQPL